MKEMELLNEVVREAERLLAAFGVGGQALLGQKVHNRAETLGKAIDKLKDFRESQDAGQN